MKNRIIILFAVVVIVFAGWSGVWLYAAGQIDRQVALMAEPPDAETPALLCGSHEVMGWPFRFDVTCDDARIVYADETYSLQRIKATALVYDPRHILAFFTGPLHYSNAFYGTERELRWNLAELSARLDGWRLARISLHAEDLAFYDTLIGDTLLASSPLAELHFIGEPQKHDAERGLSDIAVYARADTVEVPAAAVTGGRVTFDAEITALPDDVRQWAGPAILERWQGAGGGIAIHGLKADDARSQLELTGNLALNDRGEVEGDLALTSNGLAERLGAVIPENMRPVVFGGKQEDGSYKQTILIRRGGIFAGLAPIAAIPPLF